MGTAISYALAKHMIQTGNKGNLIKVLVQMGRGPPNLKGLYPSMALIDGLSIHK